MSRYPFTNLQSFLIASEITCKREFPTQLNDIVLLLFYNCFVLTYLLNVTHEFTIQRAK